MIARLREAFGFERDGDLANFLEIAPSSLSLWKSRDSVNFSLLIEKFPDLSLDWLLHDVGKPRLSEQLSKRAPPIESGMQPYTTLSAAHPTHIPLFLVPSPAGHTTPGDDHVLAALDLCHTIVPDGAECFACEVSGDSMKGSGFAPGDIIIVQRNREAQPGNLVVASVDGDLTFKRFVRIGKESYLYPDNESYQPIQIRDGMTVQIWGVVIRSVKKVG